MEREYLQLMNTNTCTCNVHNDYGVDCGRNVTGEDDDGYSGGTEDDSGDGDVMCSRNDVYSGDGGDGEGSGSGDIGTYDDDGDEEGDGGEDGDGEGSVGGEGGDGGEDGEDGDGGDGLNVLSPYLHNDITDIQSILVAM